MLSMYQGWFSDYVPGTPLRLTVPKSPNFSTAARASSRASLREGSASCDTSLVATPRQTPRSARQQSSGAIKRTAPVAAGLERQTPVKPVLTVPQVSVFSRGFVRGG
jgi:hypothetical protein